MRFGLMFFASNEEALSGEKYRLVLESARFADVNGFSSVWVPERHFTEFGSLYPNPAVLHAAVAACTERVKLMAGSVVAPLHHPLRIAEEWSMVDNLSRGRVGISFAPGWNPDDFVLEPGAYATRQQTMEETIRTVQHLWRGGTLDAENGKGEARQVRMYPTPVQSELPVWITSAGNPQTFIKAGEMGANLLTHILDQDEEQLAQKIKLYRDARSAKGFDPAAGSVTAMLHTFVGKDAAQVREQARMPFCNYIRSNIGLLNGLAQSRGQQVDIRSMPTKQLDDFVNFLYERFAQSRGLIGTPESCLPLVHKLEAMGVDEIACLLDFGPTKELILENMPHLQRLQSICRREDAGSKIHLDPAVVQNRCMERIEGDLWRKTLRQNGIAGSEEIEVIWRESGEVLARIALQPGAVSSIPEVKSSLLLEACADVLATAMGWEEMRWSIGGFQTLRKRQQPAGEQFWIHAVASAAFSPSTSPAETAGEVRVFDSEGRLLFELDAMRLQLMSESGLIGEIEAPRAWDDLLYRRDWKPLEAWPESTHEGRWLVIADRTGLGERLAEALESAGGLCVLSFDAPGSGDFKKHFAEDHALEGVLYLRSLDLAPTDLTGRKQVSADVLEIVKTLAANEGHALPRLWILTSGAMPVLSGERPAVAQTPIWGLGQAIAAEHPQMWGGLIDLDPAVESSGKSIWGTIGAANGEDMLAMRGQRLYAQRIVRNDVALRSSPTQLKPLQLDKNATYLVTGRLGGLGLHLAARLRARGAQHIALLGRSDPAAGSQHDRFFSCDLSNLEDTVATVRKIEHSMPPLKGVFHLAGTLDDGLLVHQNAERFYASGTGKAEGAWNLHLATEDIALDHFVLYSTMATLLTVPGQASYAAANIVLDALAHRRQAEGKKALCVNWGPWSDLGMTATEYGRAANERLAAAGINALNSELALDVLERLMVAGATQSTVARIEWARLFTSDPRFAASLLVSGFREVNQTAVYQETELMADLRACSRVDRSDLLRTVIASMIAENLRLPSADAISPSQSFFDLGVDSIIALEFTNRLSRMLGRQFPGTLLFTSPTVEALVDCLLLELEPFSIDTRTVKEVNAPFPKAFADELTEEEISTLIAQEIGS